MEKMLYTAASGAVRILEAQSIRANNLANAETTGFKADLERVKAMPLPGTAGSFNTRVLAQTQGSGFSQQSGVMNPTGRKLDLAIRDQGMFSVMADGAEAYTRAGALVADAEGQLTIDGRPVLGVDGPLALPEYKDLFIGEDGTISVLPSEGGVITEVGRLKLVNSDLAQMQKGQDGLLYRRDGQALAQDGEVRVDSGFLEASNVQAVTELIASMDLSRQFEIQVKLMKSAEKLADAGNRLLRNV
ncbi:flagellar basal body rod protein FlgF [Shewanella salipaludis]|uniref:Flagellar basal-body rod protein FlgF n=1 Tax=Shewanella salipaludis TaxID=2723052 RepID=A0A972FW68_9GAMM|nr:flagellar basal body rod protein FlgF [Shewanella salipaludis]NMH66732.1 flagellar basal body rod protein FlgF [Shewanella salipaludis]